MKNQKMSLIGVAEEKRGSITFGMIRDIFINSGFSLVYENKNIVFLTSNENNYIGIINFSLKNLKYLSSLGLKFNIIVYANIGYETKLSKEVKLFFASLDSIIMLNIDDENNIKLLEGNNKALVITYGLNNKATVTASSLDMNNLIEFNFCLQREIKTLKGDIVEPLDFPVKINFLSKEFIYSALASITVGLCYDLNIDNIRDGLLNVKGFDRNMEKLYEGDFTIIDNFCLNPVDYNIAFENIQHLKYKDIVLLKGIEIDQGIYTIKKNLEIVVNWAPIIGIRRVVFFVDKKDTLVEKNIEYLFIKKKIPYSIYYNLKHCLESELKSVKKDDILLLLGNDVLNNSKDILINQLKSQ